MGFLRMVWQLMAWRGKNMAIHVMWSILDQDSAGILREAIPDCKAPWGWILLADLHAVVASVLSPRCAILGVTLTLLEVSSPPSHHCIPEGADVRAVLFDAGVWAVQLYECSACHAGTLDLFSWPQPTLGTSEGMSTVFGHGFACAVP